MESASRMVESAYAAHAAGLLGYLRRLLGRADQAEDALQETFVQALRHADRLAGAASQRAWLFGVARHVGLTFRRHRATAALCDAIPARGEAESDARLVQMRRQIERLPDGPREALELRLRHELSYEEIAAVLEIPVGTVRSRLHAAVRQLRENLSPDSEAS